MKLNEYISKEYCIPLNVPISSEDKYVEVINKGYAKYVDIIATCGDVAMFEQFYKLVKCFTENKELSDSRYKAIGREIISRLEKFGFIGTKYLNKYKYVFLKQPSYALSEGDYLTYRRTNLRKNLRTDRFINSVVRLQNLLDNGFVYEYSNLHNQLMYITKIIYSKIQENNNLFGYDLILIKRIIELNDYRAIKDLLGEVPEYKNKLGIIRMIWLELGKEFDKLNKLGQTISDDPLYLSVNILDDGCITIHYIPNIVIYDSYRDLDYYNAQSVKYFNMFLKLSGNLTSGMRKIYESKNNLGALHHNRIGYTVTLIGSDLPQLINKVAILNKGYLQNDMYSPLVKECGYIHVDVDKYFSQASRINTNNETFNKEFKALDEKINIAMGRSND